MSATESETGTDGAGRPDVIGDALRAVVEFCGLDLAYVSEFHDGSQWIRRTMGDAGTLSIPVDQAIDLETSYCQRVIDGRLTNVVPDTAVDEVVCGLPTTTAAGVRAYAGAAIRFSDGRLYGTLCGISDRPMPELGQRHADLMQLLARLVGTELERAAEDRGDSAAIRSQNEFLATVSHDLRTPLRAVSFIAEDLAAGDDDLEPGPAAQMIIEEVDSVMGMVDDVLLVARQRSGSVVIDPETVDLVDVAERALRTSAAAAGVGGGRLRSDLPDGPLGAFVDGSRVGQAVRNLLDNALKYSDEGDPVLLRLDRDDTTAVFEVHDVGIGVAPEEVEQLGTRFFRSTSAREHGIDGIGLGLASVQAIAEAHEGVLSVSSVPGRGSVFRLRLPLGRAA